MRKHPSAAGQFRHTHHPLRILESNALRQHLNAQIHHAPVHLTPFKNLQSFPRHSNPTSTLNHQTMSSPPHRRPSSLHLTSILPDFPTTYLSFEITIHLLSTRLPSELVCAITDYAGLQYLSYDCFVKEDVGPRMYRGQDSDARKPYVMVDVPAEDERVRVERVEFELLSRDQGEWRRLCRFRCGWGLTWGRLELVS